jgi:hypothetical protein
MFSLSPISSSYTKSLVIGNNELIPTGIVPHLKCLVSVHDSLSDNVCGDSASTDYTAQVGNPNVYIENYESCPVPSHLVLHAWYRMSSILRITLFY